MESPLVAMQNGFAKKDTGAARLFPSGDRHHETGDRHGGGRRRARSPSANRLRSPKQHVSDCGRVPTHAALGSRNAVVPVSYARLVVCSPNGRRPRPSSSSLASVGRPLEHTVEVRIPSAILNNPRRGSRRSSSARDRSARGEREEAGGKARLCSTRGGTKPARS
jgi:hypothetical protein